jgi:oligosaccharide repeat unit polymerase
MGNFNPAPFGILICLILTLTISKVLFKSIFTPLGVYSFFWGFALFLFHLHLLPYPPLTSTAKIAIFGSYLTFFLGSITVSLLKEKKLQGNKSNIFYVNTNNLKVAMVATGILGAIGAIKRVLSSLAVVGIAGMLKGSMRIIIYGFREGVGISVIWGLLYSLNFIAGVFSGYYIATKSHKNLFSFLPLISIIIGSISTGGRTSILFILLLYFFGYLFGSKKSLPPYLKRPNETKLIFIVSLMLVVFLSLGTIIWYSRGGLEIAKANEPIYETKLPLQIIHYYHYIVCSFPALDRYISTYDATHTWGAGILYPIFHQFERIGLIEKLPVQGTNLEAVNIPLKTNVYSYLRVLYQDFGIIGTILVPYIIGLLTSWLYISFFVRPNFPKLVLLSYTCLYLLSSFYEYFVYNGGLLFSLCIGLFLSAFLFKGKEN